MVCTLSVACETKMHISKIDVSFIIVDYNAFLPLQRLIDTIRKKTKDISYEIIIVDNSKDTKNLFSKKTILTSNIYSIARTLDSVRLQISVSTMVQGDMSCS